MWDRRRGASYLAYGVTLFHWDAATVWPTGRRLTSPLAWYWRTAILRLPGLSVAAAHDGFHIPRIYIRREFDGLGRKDRRR